MNLLEITFPSPAENLACDEALLERCEEEGAEALRLWESAEPFVVVGYGNCVEREVNVDECARRGVPILRRCTGGGTVVQGPGCLNYTLALRSESVPELQTVTGTNRFVMERNRAIVASLFDRNVAVQGHTDLAFQSGGQWWKFSGNAQRRRRNAVLFHGTFLHRFDLGLVAALLRFPSAQPEYRAHRPHEAFIRNLPVPAPDLRRAMAAGWKAQSSPPPAWSERLAHLVRERYGDPNWNRRR